jgi:type IV pilus assembly protein PilC
MPRFSYSAVDPSGRAVRGTMEAEDEELVLAKLHEQHMHVTNVKRARSSSGTKSSLFKPKKPKLQSLVVFSRQFATMIDAGIPILRCLEILGSQTKDQVLAQAIHAVRQDVKGGQSLNEALAKHPTVFSKLYVNMIRAAEIGGILDTILDRLSLFLESEMEIRGKIKSAMMYPTMVLVASVGMLFALFSFVLPRFKDIFIGMDVEMPAITSALFSVGDFFQAYWWTIIGGAVGAFFAMRYYGRTKRGRYHFDYVKLRLPIVGDLNLKLSVARFARTFGTLIGSGVPMMRSLEIVGETSGNAILASAIDAARGSVREGQQLSTPLAQSGLFPSMVTQMIDIGEESGRLNEMLVKVSDFYDTEVAQTVKGLTSMIEPLLIVVMGVIVAFIAISVMSPIFKLVNSVQ